MRAGAVIRSNTVTDWLLFIYILSLGKMPEWKQTQSSTRKKLWVWSGLRMYVIMLPSSGFSVAHCFLLASIWKKQKNLDLSSTCAYR